MNKVKMTGAALALGAAAIFSIAPATAVAYHQHGVKCLGANGCKGLSSCQTANNACKGKNSCKGQGFVMLKNSQCQQVLGNTNLHTSGRE